LEEVMTYRYAVGHGVPCGTPRVLRPWHMPRSITPAGGIIASLKDQLRYARFQLGDGTGATGERVLEPNSLAAMRQPLLPSTGLPQRMIGLAWNISQNNISHGGGTHGQNTFLLICPEQKIALSVLTNAPVGTRVIDVASRWVLEHLAGVPWPQTPCVPVDGAVLDGCVGLYQHPHDDLEVGRLGEALVAREIAKGGFPTKDTPPDPSEPAPLMRLGFYAPDRLVGLDSPFQDLRCEVLRGPDGAVDWLRYGGRIRRRVR
jgi:CubicO group peptidase (beta-lactamase class C family)